MKGTIVECNTAYGGSRAETAMHMQVAKDHGFTDIADVDILDADGSMELPVKGGKWFTEMSVGASLPTYDSMVVLPHFKGHLMGGFGGSNKNIGIGCADGRIGKILNEVIHEKSHNIVGQSEKKRKFRYSLLPISKRR